MKQIIISCMLLLSAANAAGQMQTVDSLVNVLETRKLTAEEQFSIYVKLCTLYQMNDPEKNLIYAQEGLKLAEKVKNKPRMAEFNNFYGRYYGNIGDYELANKYFNAALNISVEIHDKDLELQSYGNLAVSYSNKGDLKTGIEYYQKALDILDELGREEKAATWLANIGGTYRQLGEYDLAEKYLKKAEKIAEKTDDKKALQKVYPSLGNLYHVLNNLDQAMEYGKKALAVAQDLNDKWGASNAYQTLTAVSIDNKQYDEAEKYANESLRLAKEINNKRMILAGMNLKAHAFFNQGRYTEAEKTALTALETDSTILYMNESLISTIVNCNIFLGKKVKAKEYFDKYANLQIEIRNKNAQENLIEMETKYETEKKELRIASLEKERQLYIWLGIAGILFAFVIGIALWLSLKNARKERQLIATRSVLDGEMKERARLAQDLHDRLSGNLSAVKIELGNHADTLQNVRDKLNNCIRDIRDAAHNLMPASLQNGMKVALEDFAAQFPNVRFHFFGQEKRVDGRTEFVVYCCACELVNNSVKHAGAQHINLQLVQDEKYVTLTVSDDGCGFDEKAATKGFGLKSIRDRVASCNGKIDIFTAPSKGTETTIELKTKKPY